MGTQHIPAETTILEYTGKVLETPTSEDNCYAYVTTRGTEIDGRQGGICRLVNHGSTADEVNCRMYEFEEGHERYGRVYLKTIRAVKQGEELLYYYSDSWNSVLNSEDPVGWTVGGAGQRGRTAEGRREGGQSEAQGGLELVEGLRVEAQYGYALNEAWFTAQIVSVNKGGTFDVTYDVDGETELCKTAERIRSITT